MRAALRSPRRLILRAVLNRLSVQRVATTVVAPSDPRNHMTLHTCTADHVSKDHVDLDHMNHIT